MSETPATDRSDDEYTVRPFESDDEEAFRSLFEAVLGGRASAAWFDWKYRANPYADHVPVLLAETDGEVVGARAFFALELRADGRAFSALQPCDTMVRRDHRRRGLFTRMTEAAIDRYADEADYFFNFPNHLSLPGNLDLGWEVVAERATHYRVQDPSTWVEDALPTDSDEGVVGAVESPGRLAGMVESSGRLAEVVASAGASAGRLAGRLGARAYLSVRDRLAPEETGVARRWHDGVPAGLLGSLADAGAPGRIHVARDERFYDWRFENPRWNYETVVARDGGGRDGSGGDRRESGANDDSPTAALVVGRRTRPDGTAVARLADVVPLVGGADRERALSALLAAVVRRHADADLLLAPGDPLPSSLLSAYGFHSDLRPPLSWVSSPTVQVARPVADDGDWTVGERERALTDARNWLLAGCEQDSG
ncbi:GNAT family N-acetyltransferase [Halorussus salinus]|uniref:GNAT family N-acetyltransferase n=1 Tax=Halorussus salinus TaxID=1364935 RepID=UPI00192F2209|nr:GNAT family N-acetyltransferase [Halorussus salinus]